MSYLNRPRYINTTYIYGTLGTYGCGITALLITPRIRHVMPTKPRLATPPNTRLPSDKPWLIISLSHHHRKTWLACDEPGHGWAISGEIERDCGSYETADAFVADERPCRAVNMRSGELVKIMRGVTFSQAHVLFAGLSASWRRKPTLLLQGTVVRRHDSFQWRAYLIM